MKTNKKVQKKKEIKLQDVFDVVNSKYFFFSNGRLCAGRQFPESMYEEVPSRVVFPKELM